MVYCIPLTNKGVKIIVPTGSNPTILPAYSTGKLYFWCIKSGANLVNGNPTFNTTWSWWGFFGGWAFFLYRKMYLMAGIFFILSILSALIPFGGLILAIITGVSAFYFYTVKLHNDLTTAGYEHRDIELVKEDLRKLGGYNSWVVFVAIIFYTFMILFTIGGVFTSLLI